MQRQQFVEYRRVRRDFDAALECANRVRLAARPHQGRKALLENASSESAIAHLTSAIELGFSAPAVYQDLDTALVERCFREAARPVEQEYDYS